MKQKKVLYFCMILIGFSIGLFLYNFFNPDSILNEPLSFEGFKEESVNLYNKMVGGEEAPEKGDGSFFREADVVGGWEYVNGTKIFTSQSETSFLGLNEKGEKVFGTKRFTVPEFVNEDNKLKRKEDAESLKGTEYFFEQVEDDGLHEIEFVDWNWTSVQIKGNVKDAKSLNKDIPIKKDGVIQRTVRLTSLESGSETITIHFEEWHGTNISIGENSSVYTTAVDSNSTYADTMFLSNEPDGNYGGFAVFGGRRYINDQVAFASALHDIDDDIGINNLIINYTVCLHAHEVLNAPTKLGTFFVSNVMVKEGGSTGGNVNGSWHSNNDSCFASNTSSGEARWTLCDTDDCEIKDEFKGDTLLIMTNTPVQQRYACYEFDNVTVQAEYDKNGNLTWLFNLTDPVDATSRGIDFNTVEDGDPWHVYIEYSIPNNAPVCTVAADTNKSISEDTGTDVDSDMGAAGGIHCTDADADTIYYSELASSGVGGFSIVGANLSAYPTANSTGEGYVTVNASDGLGGDAFVDVNVSWTDVNDPPWWNETSNTTYSYDEDFGSDFTIWDEDGLNNTYQDVEENHVPNNCTVSLNETIIFTSARWNGSIIADSVANKSGGVSVIVNCSDRGWLSAVTGFVVTVNDVNDVLVWDEITNQTCSEDDSCSVVVNLDAYSWDVEDDAVPVNMTYSIIEAGSSVIDCSIAGADMTCLNQDGNETGDNLVNISALDSGGASDSINFNVSVMPINDAPWWDDVTNNSVILFYNSLNQNVSVGFADYFQDVEDPNNPTLGVLSDNSSALNCSVQTGDLICDTSLTGGNAIINLQGNDSGLISAYMSFEVAINIPPITPPFMLPEDNALNDTFQLNLSCADSTDIIGGTIRYDYYGSVNADVLTNSTNQICLNVGSECLWNNTDMNRWVYWKCYANDTYDNSSASGIKSIRTETWDIIDVNLSAPSEVRHSDVMNFDVNVSWNELRFTDAYAILNVSGYNYSAVKTQYDNYTHFTVDVTYNNSLWADESLGYLWNITLPYKNGSLFENSSTFGGTINTFDIYLYNCSATNESILFNITGFHEDTIDLLAVDIDAKIDVWTENKDFAKTFTFEWNDTQPVNVSNFSKSHYVCLSYNTSVYVDAYFLYSSPGGFVQRYYINNFIYQNNTNNEIHLFNRDYTSGVSTLKGATRYADSYNYFSNIIAKLQRYYVSEDVWRLVQMDKSGDFGLVHFNIKEVEKDYKFTFQDEDNHVLKTTESMKFKCDPDTSICELTFLIDPWTGAVGIGDLQVSHIFDNDTGLITVNWNDPTGITSEVRILVTKENMGGSVEICNSAFSGSAGSYSCNASLYTGQLLLKVLSTASPESPVYMEWIERFGGRLSDLIGADDSAWWVFGISLTLTLGGAAVSPVAGIIAFVVSLVVLFSLEMASFITISFITLAVVLGLAIGVKVKS